MTLQDRLLILLSLKERADLANVLYSQGEIHGSAVLIGKIWEELEEARSALAKNNEEFGAYLELLIKKRIPGFTHGRASAKKWTEKSLSSASFEKDERKELWASIQDARLSTALLFKETRRFAGKGMWLGLLRPVRKGPSLVLAGIILAAAGLLSYHWTTSQRRGLMGHYFSGTEFNQLQKKRVDSAIQFSWEREGPFPEMVKDEFSVRWTGYLKIEEPGNYEFFTISDDGVRLQIGKTLLIEDWTRHFPKQDSARLKMDEGYYPITLEYFEKTKDATIKLFWRPEAQIEKTAIPSSLLIAQKKYLKAGVPLHED